MLLRQADASAKAYFRKPSAVEVVAFLAVLREVEAGGFVFCRDAQTDRLVDEEEENQCADERDAPGNRNADELVEHLVPVAVEAAGGQQVAAGVLAVDGVDDRLGE